MTSWPAWLPSPELAAVCLTPAGLILATITARTLWREHRDRNAPKEPPA